ncbi:MAG TPA: AsmA-like C-terminal region-containing protein [Hyphomicrobiaceae bacterium]|nr:AsmA-like C-terminal region-containing protein [Hyphomicrobiaceae bacterium]
MRALIPRARLMAVAIAIVGGLLLLIAAPLLFGPSSRLRLASVVASARDSMVITAPVRLSSTAPLVIDAGSIFSSDIPTAKSPVSGRMVIDGASIVVSQPEPGPHASDDSVVPILSVLVGPGFDRLTIRRTEIRFSRSGRPGDLLANVSAEVTRRKQGLHAKGKFTYLGQRLRFEATTGPIVADIKTKLRQPLRLVVTGAWFSAVFDGHLDIDGTVSLDGQGEVSISDPRRAMRWLGLPIGSGESLRRTRAKGTVVWRNRTIAFQTVALAIDGNEATGALTVDFEGPRPLFDGTLAVKTLDLTPYIELEKSEPGMARRVEHHLPLARDIDIDMRLSAATLIVGPHKFGGVAATVALKAGRLIADIAEMDFSEGTIGGQVLLDLAAMPTVLAVRGRAQNFDLARISSALVGFAAGQGPATLTVDASARGATAIELLRSLSGKASLALSEGGRLAVDVRHLIDADAPKDDLRRLWAAAKRGSTSFDKLEIKLSMRNGVVQSELVELASGPAGVAVVGSYSLISDVLDLSIRRSKGASLAPAGKAASARVLGPSANPDIVRSPN